MRLVQGMRGRLIKLVDDDPAKFVDTAFVRVMDV
jgi:hypothetical protein